MSACTCGHNHDTERSSQAGLATIATTTGQEARR